MNSCYYYLSCSFPFVGGLLTFSRFAVEIPRLIYSCGSFFENISPPVAIWWKVIDLRRLERYHCESIGARIEVCIRITSCSLWLCCAVYAQTVPASAPSSKCDECSADIHSTSSTSQATMLHASRTLNLRVSNFIAYRVRNLKTDLKVSSNGLSIRRPILTAVYQASKNNSLKTMYLFPLRLLEAIIQESVERMKRASNTISVGLPEETKTSDDDVVAGVITAIAPGTGRVDVVMSRQKAGQQKLPTKGTTGPSGLSAE